MMNSYQILFARSARKELQALPSAIAKKIIKKIELLAAEPRPFGCNKLRGSMDLWRIRVGEYRIVYHIDGEKGLVDIMIVRHRSEVYR